MLQLTICDGKGTQAVILPEKGATVVSLTRNNVEFLYRDEENLRSPERPRCGIPFLFPIFGRLQDSRYTWDGETYAMEIHGFGHTSSWQVAQHTADTLRLVLEADENTLSQYPFRFRVSLTFRVSEGALTISQTYENTDAKPMPYSFGFHPYFLTEQLEDLQVETTAQTYYNYDLGASDFGHGTVRLNRLEKFLEIVGIFSGVQGPTILHNQPGSRKLTMEFDDSFHTHVLWTLPGRRFLCVEPINGTANGLNTGNYMILNPGERKEAFVTFRPETL